jgi:Glucanosyltransferase
MDHSICMKLLAEAGIYVLINLNALTQYSFYDKAEVWKPRDYTLVENQEALIDTFHSFSNTLGFYVDFTDVIQDIVIYKGHVIHAKKYMRERGYRDIPIGFFYTDVVNAWNSKRSWKQINRYSG